MSLINFQIPNIPNEYMNNQDLAKSKSRGDRPVAPTNHSKKLFADITEWETHLAELQIVKHRHIKIATEGALIGSILHSGLPQSLTIVSDDAGQYEIKQDGDWLIYRWFNEKTKMKIKTKINGKTLGYMKSITMTKGRKNEDQ